MRILFTIGDLGSGGAEKVISTLANCFTNSNHSVAILMISESEKKSFYELNKNVELIPLVSKEGKNSIRSKVGRIRNVIEEYKPDAVISFLNYVIVYTHYALKGCSNRKNISFIVSERNNPKKVPESFCYRLLRNHIFKKADGCVFQTGGAKSYFKTVKNYFIIPNPVFLNNKRVRSAINEDVLLVGSDKKEKNRSMAYKAFAIYRKENANAKLIIVGDQSSKKELDLINKLGIKNSVMFVGKLNDWHTKYINSKMFLLSSDYEGMPNALLEACALQIPCISTDCPSGGPKEILENGKRGILVPAKDYKEMSNKMIELSKNEELLNYYSDINKDIKEKYDENLIAMKWLDFIVEIKNNKD